MANADKDTTLAAVEIPKIDTSDMFDASEVATMACEEIVDYHKSLMRMEEMDEIREEGREEGLKEGMEKGMEKGIFKMVKSMFSNGLSMDLIAKYCNLPLPQVRMILEP